MQLTHKAQSFEQIQQMNFATILSNQYLEEQLKKLRESEELAHSQLSQPLFSSPMGPELASIYSQQNGNSDFPFSFQSVIESEAFKLRVGEMHSREITPKDIIAQEHRTTFNPVNSYHHNPSFFVNNSSKSPEHVAAIRSAVRQEMARRGVNESDVSVEVVDKQNHNPYGLYEAYKEKPVGKITVFATNNVNEDRKTGVHEVTHAADVKDEGIGSVDSMESKAYFREKLYALEEGMDGSNSSEFREYQKSFHEGLRTSLGRMPVNEGAVNLKELFGNSIKFDELPFLNAAIDDASIGGMQLQSIEGLKLLDSADLQAASFENLFDPSQAMQNIEQTAAMFQQQFENSQMPQAGGQMMPPMQQLEMPMPQFQPMEF